jgi:hypothetical protein
MASGRNVQSKMLCNSACSVVTLFCCAHSSWTARSDGECSLLRELKRPSGLGQAIELLIRIVEVHSSNVSRTTSFELCHSLFTIIQSFYNVPRCLPTGSLIKYTIYVPKNEHSEICFKVFDISGIKCNSRRGYYVKFLIWNTVVNLKMKETRDVLYEKYGDYFIFNFVTQQPLVGEGFSLSRIHDHTQTHHTRWDSSGRVISPTQTAHNNHKRQTSMPRAGFEPIIPASKRPQTHALRPRSHRDRHVGLKVHLG